MNGKIRKKTSHSQVFGERILCFLLFLSFWCCYNFLEEKKTIHITTRWHYVLFEKYMCAQFYRNYNSKNHEIEIMGCLIFSVVFILKILLQRTTAWYFIFILSFNITIQHLDMQQHIVNRICYEHNNWDPVHNAWHRCNLRLKSNSSKFSWYLQLIIPPHCSPMGKTSVSQAHVDGHVGRHSA